MALNMGWKETFTATSIKLNMWMKRAFVAAAPMATLACRNGNSVQSVHGWFGWANRIRGLRANASSLDHGTLCQLGHLEEGNPDELVSQYVDIRAAHPKMNVFGGFCGTDYMHVEKIGRALLTAA
jgi:S-methylmethionine-dependent homocysteine/selenocysteine methylase